MLSCNVASLNLVFSCLNFNWYSMNVRLQSFMKCMVLYLGRMCQCWLHAMFWSDISPLTVCASSLQNLSVPQDFYLPVCIYVERSCWPRVRLCGTGVFQEQSQLMPSYWPSYSVPFCLLLFSLSLLSLYALVFGLIWCMLIAPSQPCTANL